MMTTSKKKIVLLYHIDSRWHEVSILIKSLDDLIKENLLPEDKFETDFERCSFLSYSDLIDSLNKYRKNSYRIIIYYPLKKR